MQYTIRNISPSLDSALKSRAKQMGKSLNQLALEALERSVGQPIRYRNLRNMPGAWSRQEAKRFDQFLAEHRNIDEELWK